MARDLSRGNKFYTQDKLSRSRGIKFKVRKGRRLDRRNSSSEERDFAGTKIYNGWTDKMARGARVDMAAEGTRPFFRSP